MRLTGSIISIILGLQDKLCIEQKDAPREDERYLGSWIAHISFRSQGHGFTMISVFIMFVYQNLRIISEYASIQ